MSAPACGHPDCPHWPEVLTLRAENRQLRQELTEARLKLFGRKRRAPSPPEPPAP